MTDAAVRHYGWDELEMEQVGPGLDRRFIVGERLMMAQIRLAAGVKVPSHRHEHEQITNVLAGRMEFRFGENGEDKRVVGAGEVVVIPSNLPHQAEVLEAAEVIELFAPPRQDWIDGTDGYLRGSDG
ncbi:MAG: cupin domain-containing protein [Alphaproteobacteria bacterium]|jgi:quercetin dioxygenase-like cupin family protein|nr:cupin domain-containing protein [Alphaproteobacteria bacterium]MDP6814576.1 cupin domain-containing protein [Alphaproteobacteria bacterium]